MSVERRRSGADTIVALATPVGRSGLGVIRLSGPQAIPIASAVFRPRNCTRSLDDIPPFTVRLGSIVEGERVVDEVLLLIMRAPRSYTREDVVEFSCHGSPVTLRRIEDLCVAHGARRAGPGEFTRRAFLNGRIDLAQAEAVCAMIAAESELQAEIAARSLSGSARTLLNDVRRQLADAAAALALLVDYPDDPETAAVHPARIDELLRAPLHALERIRAAVAHARPFFDGASVVLCGKPNAGKSSLFNVLVNRDRSIVSSIPGTTRDTITERITIGGLPLTLIDTAGMRTASDDPLETLGMERARRAVRDSDVVILLLDAAAGRGPDDDAAVEHLRCASRDRRRRAIVAVNKMDAASDVPAVRRAAREVAAALSTSYDTVAAIPEVSCVTLQGIADLERALLTACCGAASLTAEELEAASAAVTRRQADLLDAAAGHLAAAADAGAHRPELAAERLAAALRDLAAITGESAPPDAIEEVFSRFCVGK